MAEGILDSLNVGRVQGPTLAKLLRGYTAGMTARK